MDGIANASIGHWLRQQVSRIWRTAISPHFYDRHGNPVGDSENPNSDLTDAPEEKTEENEPVPEITGVDQEPLDDKEQDLKTPDDNQNDNDINYGTEKIGDPTE